MSLIANGAGEQPTGFYNNVATQSLRFDNGSSAYLSRTPSSASNRKTFTWSGWIKPSAFGKAQPIFSAYTNATNYSIFGFDLTGFIAGGDSLRFWTAISNSQVCAFTTNALFRDPSAWYHIVLALDTTQGTNTNRVKIYVNGTQITSFATATYPSQNADAGMINSDVLHQIGTLATGSYGKLDGYMAEVNFVDGTQLTPTSFGETKNGVWIAKKYTGSYGTNGFRLQFDQVGVGTASTSTIGADTSGNTHHFTSSGIVASDCAMPDSPENNFMTFNPLMRQSQGSDFPVTHEGNLQAQFTGSDQYKYMWSTFNIKPNTGKWYFEVEMQTNMGSTNDIAYIGLGTVGPNFYPTASNGTVGPTNFYISWRGNTGVRTLYINDAGQSQTTVTVTNMTAGQIWQFAIDTDTGKVWLGLNNSYYAADGGTDGNPSAGTNESGTFSTNTNELSFFGQAQNYNITNVYYTLNAGQDSSFHENKTAQGNTDANGIGDFYYAPPTGYKAICSANLPEPTIGSNSDTQSDDHFSTTLWTGDDSFPRQITTGLSSSDWIVTKYYNQNVGGVSYDSSRGAGTGNDLPLNSGGAETANSGSAYGHVSDFNNDSNGVTLADGSINGAFVNSDGGLHVMYAWKANDGTTSSNSNGSITSAVQANTDAGFSIVTYTGTGSNATIGHGLSSTPDVVLVKRRTGGTGFWTYWGTQFSASTHYIYLNETAGTDTGGATVTNSTFPASTVFSIGTSTFVNASSDPYVAYCFHSVEGYSRFGTYTGNGAADGVFVFTGFRPAWVMVKRTSDTGSWVIMDNKRKTFNFNNALLYPNLSDAANSNDGYNGTDFLSNGFKIRGGASGVGTDVSGASSYLYMAFAEAPFKYANAK